MMQRERAPREIPLGNGNYNLKYQDSSVWKAVQSREGQDHPQTILGLLREETATLPSSGQKKGNNSG